MEEMSSNRWAPFLYTYHSAQAVNKWKGKQKSLDITKLLKQTLISYMMVFA